MTPTKYYVAVPIDQFPDNASIGEEYFVFNENQLGVGWATSFEGLSGGSLGTDPTHYLEEREGYVFSEEELKELVVVAFNKGLSEVLQKMDYRGIENQQLNH